MYPTQELLAELRAGLDLEHASPEGTAGSQGLGQSRYKRPWHWLPEMRSATGHLLACRIEYDQYAGAAHLEMWTWCMLATVSPCHCLKVDQSNDSMALCPVRDVRACSELLLCTWCVNASHMRCAFTQQQSTPSCKGKSQPGNVY